MKATEARPRNFSPDYIIYESEDFAIAYVMWRNGNQCLAMRWTGDDEDQGYPKVFKNPMWFIVEDALKSSILGGLATQPKVDLNVLEEVIKIESGQSGSRS
jgi:hypothetical protein